MTEPFTGEIQIFGFTFAPANWAFASGQTIPIRQNAALYSLLGITYGGDGTNFFQLPNLASRQACGSGSGPATTPRRVGDIFGNFTVALTTETMPAHNHGMNIYLPGSSTQTVVPDVNSGLSTVASGAFNIYAAPAGGTAVQMSPQMVQIAGAGQPHPNDQPYLGLNYSIALVGNFPPFS